MDKVGIDVCEFDLRLNLTFGPRGCNQFAQSLWGTFKLILREIHSVFPRIFDADKQTDRMHRPHHMWGRWEQIGDESHDQ